MINKIYVDVRQQMIHKQSQRFFLLLKAYGIENTNVRENVKQLIKNKEYVLANEVIIAYETTKKND